MGSEMTGLPAPYVCTVGDALEFLQMHIPRGEACCGDCGRRAREKAAAVAQLAEDYAAAVRDIAVMEENIRHLRERGIEAGDVIERLVVCIDTDALHEELDAWAGDRMAATRILRSHVTRALGPADPRRDGVCEDQAC